MAGQLVADLFHVGVDCFRSTERFFEGLFVHDDLFFEFAYFVIAELLVLLDLFQNWDHDCQSLLAFVVGLKGRKIYGVFELLNCL